MGSKQFSLDRSGHARQFSPNYTPRTMDHYMRVAKLFFAAIRFPARCLNSETQERRKISSFQEISRLRLRAVSSLFHFYSRSKSTMSDDRSPFSAALEVPVALADNEHCLRHSLRNLQSGYRGMQQRYAAAAYRSRRTFCLATRLQWRLS